MASILPGRHGKKQPAAWMSSSTGGLEKPEDVLVRVRRKLVAAKVRSGLSWEELFVQCDKSKTGTLSWKELQYMVRQVLQVPQHTVCEHDLRVLFSEADEDRSQSLQLAELLKYLQQGYKRPEDEDARVQQRVHRAQRNVHMALSKIRGNEEEIRKIFGHADLDDSDRLSPYEFNNFVRNDLALSKWHVVDTDLNDVYRTFDRDGQGIDFGEFMTSIRQAGKSQKDRGPQNLFAAAAEHQFPRTRRRQRTYRMQLEDRLEQSKTQPACFHDATFARVGRDRRPASRHSLSTSALPV